MFPKSSFIFRKVKLLNYAVNGNAAAEIQKSDQFIKDIQRAPTLHSKKTKTKKKTKEKKSYFCFIFLIDILLPNFSLDSQIQLCSCSPSWHLAAVFSCRFLRISPDTADVRLRSSEADCHRSFLTLPRRTRGTKSLINISAWQCVCVCVRCTCWQTTVKLAN